MKLTELLTESAVDKLTSNLLNFLKEKFKSEKGITFELEKIQGLRNMFKIPEDVTHCIRMAVDMPGVNAVRSAKADAAVRSARRYLEAVIGQRFPEDNILGVVVRMIQTEDGALVVLQQDLKEELHPLLRRAYNQVFEILSTLNEDWKKDFGGKEHYLYDLSASYSDSMLKFTLTQDSNFDSEHFLQALDYIKEALEEEGYINGVMPLDVNISKPLPTPMGPELRVNITVTRSGQKPR